jgi:hypothetical protein
MRLTRLAIVAFVIATALGPSYTAEGYSLVVNVISELAAQGTPHNYIMASAFVALGAAIVVDGARAFRRALLPFMAFGLAFGAAGLFGHKPITPGVAYSGWVDATHSALATVSGVALTVGFGWQAAAAKFPRYRWLFAALAVACIGMPLLMLQAPQYQGLVQRVMYLFVFCWLWVFYPQQTDG